MTRKMLQSFMKICKEFDLSQNVCFSIVFLNLVKSMNSCWLQRDEY